MLVRIRTLLAWVLVCAGVAAVLAARPAGGQDAPESALPVGPELYLQSCASCHGDQGQGTFRGPTLVGVGAASADYWLRSGRMPLDEPDEEPRRSEPSFSEEQIRVLVAYVASLGEGPEIPALNADFVDLSRGGELYRVNCAACHNWDGRGGALVNGDNAPALHAVPSRQVAEAIRVGPGTMPVFAEDQLSEGQLNDVVGYVDYLRSPVDAGGFPLGHWGPSTETVAGFIGLLILVLVTAWAGERRRGG